MDPEPNNRYTLSPSTQKKLVFFLIILTFCYYYVHPRELLNYFRSEEFKSALWMSLIYSL